MTPLKQRRKNEFVRPLAPVEAKTRAKASTSMASRTKRSGRATTATKPDAEHAQAKDADPKQPPAKKRKLAATVTGKKLTKARVPLKRHHLGSVTKARRVTSTINKSDSLLKFYKQQNKSMAKQIATLEKSQHDVSGSDDDGTWRGPVPMAHSTQYGTSCDTDTSQQGSDPEKSDPEEDYTESNVHDSHQSRDKNKTTSVHGITAKLNAPEQETKVSLKQVSELMKPGAWPMKEFDEGTESKRGRWVDWGKRFKSACKLVPNATSDQLKTLLMLKGGQKIWEIGGDGIHDLTLAELWNKIDLHYASLGDPDAELMAYHKMKQAEGEDFTAFVTRLKQQAIYAEMPDATEELEFRSAIVERSLVSEDMAFHMKLNNMDNNGLVRLGINLCKRRDEHLQVQSIQQTRPPPVSKSARVERRTKNEDASTDYRNNQSWRASGQQKCRSCGRTHDGKCTAKSKDKLCFKCNRPGHFAYKCPEAEENTSRRVVHQVTAVSDDGWD